MILIGILLGSFFAPTPKSDLEVKIALALSICGGSSWTRERASVLDSAKRLCIQLVASRGGALLASSDLLVRLKLWGILTLGCLRQVSLMHRSSWKMRRGRLQDGRNRNRLWLINPIYLILQLEMCTMPVHYRLGAIRN
jgi:hypothetical protein